MPKLPWLKFYPSDWQSDQALGMCGLAARGLWMEMLAIMHKATPYGHLVVNGMKPSDEQLAALARAPADQIRALTQELESAGVFSRTRNGTIYSRRMTKDDKRRNDGDKAAVIGTIPGSRRDRQRTERPKQNSPLPGVDGGVEEAPPSSSEARGSSVFNKSGLASGPRARGRARGTQPLRSLTEIGGPDWSDPEVRKAAWQMKAFGIVRRHLPDKEATELIQKFMEGDKAAKAAVERLVHRAAHLGGAVSNEEVA